MDISTQLIAFASLIDNFDGSSPLNLILRFDDSGIQQQVQELRQAAGLLDNEPDNPKIIDFKAQEYQLLEEEILSSWNAEVTVIDDYSHLPLALVEVQSAEALRQLLQTPGVIGVDRDVVVEAQLTESLPLIEQPLAANKGYLGSGTAVAVLDTGADPNAPGLDGRIVYSDDIAPEDDLDDDDSGHGTNVSAIVAGVAPGTDIVALDIFENEFTFNSHIIEAMNWVIENQSTYNIVAVNLSCGSLEVFTSPVIDHPLKPVIDEAKAAGILTVAASGSGGYLNALSCPAAIDGVVSVGAVYDYTGPFPSQDYILDLAEPDKVAIFSNSADFLDLLAPGAWISAGGHIMAGTSQAAPHVSGAVAVLRAAFPEETPEQILERMTSSGVPITDPWNGITTPRLDLEAALSFTRDGARESNHDFNGNGSDDILFTGSSGNLESWNIFWDSETQTFAAFPENLHTPGLQAGGIGDIDGDDNLDIVYQAEDGTIFVYFHATQDSNGRWDILADVNNPHATLVTPGLKIGAVFDRNGDGRDEILFYQAAEAGPFAKGTNLIYDSGLPGGIPTFDLLTGLDGSAIVTPELQPRAAGLLSGENIPDIVYQNSASGEVKILNLTNGMMEAFNPQNPDQIIPGFEVRGTLNLNGAEQDVMLIQAQAGSTVPLPPWSVTTFDRVTGEFGEVLAVTPDFTALG